MSAFSVEAYNGVVVAFRTGDLTRDVTGASQSMKRVGDHLSPGPSTLTFPSSERNL